MNTEIISTISNSLNIWEDNDSLMEIKALFAPKLTSLEFKIFVEMGKATNLNPFLKEIWAIKYDEKGSPNIFIGRDGYRKCAQRHPMYDYHYSESIYSNDDFSVINGEIYHKYGMINRGTLLGAYCIVKRKDSSRYVYNVLDIKEYDTKKSVWAGKPSTMIKKVAEAQTLKLAFQELFQGTYSEYEKWEENDISDHKVSMTIDSKPVSRAVSKVNELLNKKEVSYDNIIDHETNIELQDIQTEIKTTDSDESDSMVEIGKQKNKVLDPNASNPITHDLLDEISKLLSEKPFDTDRMSKAMNYFEVKTIEDMNIGQAKRFIELINRAA
jgi:phage recombination protein Bet